MSLVKKRNIWDERDSSSAQHDEYRTDCYCSECGEYLGSTDFTYRVTHTNKIDRNMKFCPYCGSRCATKEVERMDKFILKLSKEDIGNMLLGGEVSVNYGLTDVTVKLDEHIYQSELEVEDEH